MKQVYKQNLRTMWNVGRIWRQETAFGGCLPHLGSCSIHLRKSLWTDCAGFPALCGGRPQRDAAIGNGDNPAIGLLICKDKDNVVAEYSFEEVSQPIGIAGYELSNALSKEYQRSLPTIETLESEAAKMMDTK